MASLERAFARMAIGSMPRPRPSMCLRCHPSVPRPPALASTRTFSATARQQDWLMPKRGHTSKDRKGRPRVPTGGSMRGTTVVWGDYGLRLLDHHRRISARQLRDGQDTIKKRLRGLNFKLYTRVSANIGVYKSGNETRMGKGKGSFDHWASRVAISTVIFEVKTDVHEQVVQDAFRRAGIKMPGLYECVKKGDPPKMGLTKVVNLVDQSDLMRPRKKVEPVPDPSLAKTAGRLKSNVDQLPPIDAADMPKSSLGAH